MSRQWYYAQNGQQFGPVASDQLRGMLAAGTLRSSDLVWTDSMPAWAAASQAPGLMPAAPIYAPPAPSPAAYPQAPVARPAPAPRAAAAPAYESGAEVSPTTVELLRKTKPWVRFLSVLGFIGLALALLGGAAGLVMTASAGGGLGPMVIQVAAIFLMVLIEFPALLFLSRYASRIKNLVSSGQAQDLEDALAAQKSFWKYLGILTLVLIVLYLLVLVGVLLVAGTAILRR